MALALLFLSLAVPLLFLSGASRGATGSACRRTCWPLAETRLLRLYATTIALCTAFGALEVGYPGFGRAVGHDPWDRC